MGNPAALAGFPSAVGKSRLGAFPRSGVFHGPFTHKLSCTSTSYMPWSHRLEKATVRDDVSKVIGKHTLQFGVQFTRARRTETSAANGANTGDVQGLLTFNNSGNFYTTNN